MSELQRDWSIPSDFHHRLKTFRLKTLHKAVKLLHMKTSWFPQAAHGEKHLSPPGLLFELNSQQLAV